MVTIILIFHIAKATFLIFFFFKKQLTEFSPPNKFQCFNNYTIIPYNQSFGYAVALGIIGLAKNIVLAGFDGYPEGHLMQEEMDNTIKAIKKEYPKVNLFSVTETNYKINMFSDGEIQK